MNKTAILLTLVTLLSITPVVAYAQASPKPLKINPAAERKAQALDEAQAKKADRIQELVARLSAKLDQRVARYEEFINKIQTRRSNISDLGLDTTELDRLIRVAEADLIQAKADLTVVKDNLNNLDFTQTPREIRTQIRTEIATSRQIFKDLHQSVVVVVEEFDSLLTSQE